MTCFNILSAFCCFSIMPCVPSYPEYQSAPVGWLVSAAKGFSYASEKKRYALAVSRGCCVEGEFLLSSTSCTPNVILMRLLL